MKIPKLQVMAFCNKMVFRMPQSRKTIEKKKTDNETEGYGDMITSVIDEIRREKAEKGLPLNIQVEKIIFYVTDTKIARVLNLAMADIKGTCKILETEILRETNEGKAVRGYPQIHFVVQY